MPQPVAVDRLDQPPGAGDVDLPRVPARVAGGVHHQLGAREGGRQVEAGGEVTPDTAGAGAAPRHLPHRVPGRLERTDEPLTEPPGATRDECVHVGSLACPR